MGIENSPQLLILGLLLSLGPIGVFLAVLVLFPEKIEKIATWVLFWLQRVPIFFGLVRRKYVKHDLQSRVNNFVRRLKKDAPDIGAEKFEVEWVDPAADRTSFIADDKVVVRLRENDPQDYNFVHGAFFYVSEALLQKPKRYLSVTQKESLDLYVCSKLIEEEKPSVKGYFIDQYLFPKTRDGKSKINEYLDDFEILSEGRLFFPTFLQELEHLGEKIFGKREDEKIRREVNEMIQFLKPIALRKVGEENDLEYSGEYCRFGIMFVGRPSKLTASLKPYLDYFESHFVKRPTETVYLIGLADNEGLLKRMALSFEEEYEVTRVRKFNKNLYYDDGSVREVKQCLILMRRKDTPIIRSLKGRGATRFQNGT